MVMTPPEVVRTRASSTVLENASSLVNRDFAGISWTEWRAFRTMERERGNACKSNRWPVGAPDRD